jgi:hypothetical protein
VTHPAGAWPVLVDGQLLWSRGDDNGKAVLLDASGMPAFQEPQITKPAGVDAVSTMLDPVSDVVGWIPFPRDTDVTGYISEVNGTGALGRTVMYQGFDLAVIARLDADRILVRRYFPPQGGIGATYVIDFRDGSFREVAGLRRSGDTDAYPVAVLRGTFARVSTSGDCLNVREQADARSATRGCFRDGTLLEVAGADIAAADGSPWTPLKTPSGEPGFASAEFLQR